MCAMINTDREADDYMYCKRYPISANEEGGKCGLFYCLGVSTEDQRPETIGTRRRGYSGSNLSVLLPLVEERPSVDSEKGRQF